MNKKGVNEMVIIFIIGTFVVIGIFSGVFVSYSKLAELVGVKWPPESIGPHAGTAANSRIAITVQHPSDADIRTGADCKTNCTAKCTDLNDTCYSNCDDKVKPDPACKTGCDTAKTNCDSYCNTEFTDSSTQCIKFEVFLNYNGAGPSTVNVSAVLEGDVNSFWSYETSELRQGSKIDFGTLPIPLSVASSCTGVVFTANSTDTGVGKAMYTLDKSLLKTESNRLVCPKSP